MIYAASPAIFLHEKNVQPGEASYRRTNASLDGLGKSGRSEPRNVLKKSPVPRCCEQFVGGFGVCFPSKKIGVDVDTLRRILTNFTPHLPIKKTTIAHVQLLLG